MAQQVRTALATKPDDLRLIPGTYIEGENGLLQVVPMNNKYKCNFKNF